MNNTQLLKSHAYNIFLKEKLNNFFGFLLFLSLGLGMSYLMVKVNFIIGPVILLVIISVFFLALCFRSPFFTYFIGLIMGIFIPFFGRIFPPIGAFPMGTINDGLFIIVFLYITIKKVFLKETYSNYFNNAIGGILIVRTLYIVFIQAINPNIGSYYSWVNWGARPVLVSLIIYIIFCKIFTSDINKIALFIKIWLFFALLCALYGFYQQYVGLPGFEQAFLNSNESFFDLHYVQGILRKWSFLGNSNVFGKFMSFSAIAALILLSGPFSFSKKVILFFSAVLMLMGTSFSGTRTAIAMIPLGISLFAILNLNRRITIIMFGLLGFALAFIIYAPIYSYPTINRIRSTFQPGDDASFNVRGSNRARIQPYIYSHPLGGGIGSTGSEGTENSPGHPLAGFPPDSGYLKSALEEGWIGFITFIALQVSVVITGVSLYFKIENNKIKTLIAALTCAFFAYSLSNYTSESGMQPMKLLYPVTIAAIAAFSYLYKGLNLSENKNNKSKMT